MKQVPRCVINDIIRNDPEAFQSQLLCWYDEHARDLPWRRSSDPYAIWVSEVMLQQTQVTTVIPYYTRFMQLFPTIAKLAEAEPQSLAAAWSGLGYYSRVMRLQLAARRIMMEHAGEVPSTWDAFRNLPGVGDYTAGAVLSIAFNQPYPAVDGNVKRVFSRLLCIDVPIDKGWVHDTVYAVARDLVPSDRAGDFNQALMELGALICVPNRPDCASCPVVPWCVARKEEKQTILPIRTPRKDPRRILRVAGLVCSEQQLLLWRREQGPLAGFLEFPTVDLQEAETPLHGVDRLITQLGQIGVDVAVGRQLGRAHHKFSHVIWDVQVFELLPTFAAPRGLSDTEQGAIWLPLTHVQHMSLPVALRKVRSAAMLPGA